MAQARFWQRLALITITPLILVSCSKQSVHSSVAPTSHAVASQPSTPPVVVVSPTSSPSAPAGQQDGSDPRSVVDQFYNAYVFQQKTWEQLKDYLDPNTYQQLSQVTQFDADPITNAQVPTHEYRLGESRITGDTAEVIVRLKVELRQPPPNFNREMTVVLQNYQGRWQIQNIIYSPEPLPSGEPNDLLHIWRP